MGVQAAPSPPHFNGRSCILKTHCSAMDAAECILAWHGRNGCGISNLRLNFLLYFVQAWYLMHSGGQEACFPERIEAWSFGPVVPEIYAKYRGCGSLDIPCQGSNGTKLGRQDRIAVEAVINHFNSCSLLDLYSLVLHQSPWRTAFHPPCKMEITKKSIASYFLEKSF